MDARIVHETSLISWKTQVAVRARLGQQGFKYVDKADLVTAIIRPRHAAWYVTCQTIPDWSDLRACLVTNRFNG